jgi:hypothetical protein
LACQQRHVSFCSSAMSHDMYVDLDVAVFKSLPDKSVLKCIMQPTYATQIVDLVHAGNHDINMDISTEEQVLVVNNAGQSFSEPTISSAPSTSAAPASVELYTVRVVTSCILKYPCCHLRQFPVCHLIPNWRWRAY